MVSNPEHTYRGNTAARQLALEKHKKQYRKAKRLRQSLLAVSLCFPTGGAGAVAAHIPKAEPATAAIGRKTKITEPTTSTSVPPTTVFEQPKSPDKSTTSTTKKATTSTTLTSATPSNYDPVYQAAGARFSVPPNILYGLHKIESELAGDGTLMNRQGSGARGPMQFMPSTWATYGIDGDGDGDKDIDSAVDAIFGAAHLLSKYPTIEKGLIAYGTNINKVMEASSSR